ncbi:MAG: hypothetical protein H6739_25545 [Alphaproteobacteria bacterium]|nr:hypothetical protein [Alphaproteobacteria bacterium]
MLLLNALLACAQPGDLCSEPEWPSSEEADFVHSPPFSNHGEVDEVRCWCTSEATADCVYFVVQESPTTFPRHAGFVACEATTELAVDLSETEVLVGYQWLSDQAGTLTELREICEAGG